MAAKFDRQDRTGLRSRIANLPLKTLAIPTLAAIVVALVGLALGGSRTGSSGGPPTREVAGTSVHVKIANYAFAPSNLTVRVGTTVTVRNVDATAHTATAGSGGFDSGTLKPGQSAHFTLRTPGRYSYYCQFHAFMTGTITVVR